MMKLELLEMYHISTTNSNQFGPTGEA